MDLQFKYAFLLLIYCHKGTTGLLTPFLIGSYHEMFTCPANYDKSLKMLHLNLTYLTYFLVSWWRIGQVVLIMFPFDGKWIKIIDFFNWNTVTLMLHYILPVVLHDVLYNAAHISWNHAWKSLRWIWVQNHSSTQQMFIKWTDFVSQHTEDIYLLTFYYNVSGNIV